MCSYPSVVRFSQLGELNSSLGGGGGGGGGGLEPRYTLEVIYSMHIGSLGKAIEYLGG